MFNSTKAYQLYHREHVGSPLLPLDRIDSKALSDAQFLEWCSTKKELTADDAQGSHWIKTCTGGYITEVIFHADGTLEEFTLFERLKTVGTWDISNGVLNVRIKKNTNHYQFSVIANKNINIHSAIEYKNGELHSYLKLAPIQR